ncbi:unnamed protein product [Lactuca saligna]|uniref:NADP-dependent oxidoreductase domain-containing protein n=1 Tax=Lactuca saligna TaxID=75948 RepID=A0AA36E7Y2_LACSI|nr:unnamed protein product [Lactuca saligna]
MDPLYIQPHFPFLQVSILGYGCMGLTGIYNNPLPKEEGSKVLKEAFNRGVTFFDTVDVYGVQHANEILVGKVHRVLADIVSASANATPGLGRYPPFEREVVTIATTALEGYKNDAKAMVIALVIIFLCNIGTNGLPDNKDCSLITKIQKVDKYPTLNQVWSAPNYCYRCGNMASILSFSENMEREVKFFTETEKNNQMIGPRTGVPYFLWFLFLKSIAWCEACGNLKASFLVAVLSSSCGWLVISSDGVWNALSTESALECSHGLVPESAAAQIVKVQKQKKC